MVLALLISYHFLIWSESSRQTDIRHFENHVTDERMRVPRMSGKNYMQENIRSLRIYFPLKDNEKTCLVYPCIWRLYIPDFMYWKHIHLAPFSFLISFLAVVGWCVLRHILLLHLFGKSGSVGKYRGKLVVLLQKD